MLYARIFLLALSLLFCGSAAAQTTQLEVVSTDLDPDSQRITVTLLNHSAKIAVAYAIKVREFDAGGKDLDINVRVGSDYIFGWWLKLERPDLTGFGFIRSGAERIEQFGAAPDAATAAAKVQAVVYDDCTAQGDPKVIAQFFHSRGIRADEARAAAELLETYPASPEELRSRQAKLTATHAALDPILQANPSAEQWMRAAAEQKKLSEFLAAHSKEATQ